MREDRVPYKIPLHARGHTSLSLLWTLFNMHMLFINFSCHVCHRHAPGCKEADGGLLPQKAGPSWAAAWRPMQAVWPAAFGFPA
eukprot:1160800-Pelagomonas_calceolata.AAC.1